MSNLKKISTIFRNDADPNSFRGSLSKYNMTRFPGTLNRKVPYREKDGKYRTGLDPEADYIKRMSPEEAEQEITRVKGYLEKAKAFYGDIDISPRSDFYTKMTSDKLMGTPERAPIAPLKDGDNLYNVDTPEDLIMFAYLRVHPDIAPSKDAINSGKYPKAVYYVNDDSVEDAVSSKRKRFINKAIGLLDSLTTNKMKKVGRQLGLPFTDDTTEDSVYTALDTFIKSAETGKGQKNAELFISFCEMKDENLAIRDVVKEALLYNVLRENKDGKIMRGRNVLAPNEEDAIVYLTNQDNLDDFVSIQEEIKIKKIKAAQ